MKLEHLGSIIDSQEMLVHLNTEKREKIVEFSALLQHSNLLNIRPVAKVIGILVSCSPGVKYAPLFYRQLEIEKSRAIAQNKGNFEAKCIFQIRQKSDLSWCMTKSHLNSKPISYGNADITLQTDASNLGCGAKGTNTEAVGGKWTGQDRFQHINYLHSRQPFWDCRHCIGTKTIAISSYNWITLQLSPTLKIWGARIH